MNSETVKVTHNSGMNFTAKVHGHEIVIDKENGPRPKALMLAALGGCTAFDIVSMLTKMRVPFSDFSVTSDAIQTDAEPSVYSDVTIIYSIRVAEADRVKVDRAVMLSKEKYCGVSRMFEAFAAVHFKIEFL